MWAADGARFPLLVEINHPGTGVGAAACDGSAGLPEAVTTSWERAVVHAYVILLLRSSFRHASGKQEVGWRGIRPVYTARTEAAAEEHGWRIDRQVGGGTAARRPFRGG